MKLVPKSPNSGPSKAEPLLSLGESRLQKAGLAQSNHPD